MPEKTSKDAVINVRLTTKQKERFAEEARLCNMKLSEYVLHLLQNKRITVIENGTEIAHAIYDLSNTLKNCMEYHNIPLSRIQEALSQSISKLNSCFEEGV